MMFIPAESLVACGVNELARGVAHPPQESARTSDDFDFASDRFLDRLCNGFASTLASQSFHRIADEAGTNDRLIGLRSLDNRPRLVAVEANKYIDKAGVCDAELVVDRIQLTVEGHSVLAIWTPRLAIVTERPCRWAAELMPFANIVTRPFGPSQWLRFVGHRLGD